MLIFIKIVFINPDLYFPGTGLNDQERPKLSILSSCQSFYYNRNPDDFQHSVQRYDLIDENGVNVKCVSLQQVNYTPLFCYFQGPKITPLNKIGRRVQKGRWESPRRKDLIFLWIFIMSTWEEKKFRGVKFSLKPSSLIKTKYACTWLYPAKGFHCWLSLIRVSYNYHDDSI